MKTRILIAIVLSLTLTLTARAQVPGVINYQGRIVDNGANFNNTGSFEFALINPGGTTNYWSNDGTAIGEPSAAVSLAVTNGVCSVPLGDTTVANMTVAVPASVFTNSSVLLRVWFNDGVTGFQQLSPDQRITVAGYAFQAQNAYTAAFANSTSPNNVVQGSGLNIGSGNTVNGANASVAGGQNNTAGAVDSFVGGGYGNQATNTYATVAGGFRNVAGGNGTAVAGGAYNTASGEDAMVGGGYGNQASGPGSFVGGGGLDGNAFSFSNNIASAGASTVGGGWGNTASGTGSFVGGGYLNTATNEDATVGGGLGNNAGGKVATVGGGNNNGAIGTYATVGGGEGNQATGTGSFVGGGGYDGYNYGVNTASGAASTVGGGVANTANYLGATVGGGYGNSASGTGSFVGGGGYDGVSYNGNVAGGAAATVGGGLNDHANASYATVDGGQNNSANNNYATVAGGYDNTAGGYASFVAGYQNTAGGNYSCALGQGGTANNNNSFLWCDGTRAGVSQGADTFSVLATGGIYLFTGPNGLQVDAATSMYFGTQTRQMLNLYGTQYGIGVQNSDEYFRTGSEFWWYSGGTNNNNFGNPGGGTILMRLGSTGNLLLNGTVTANAFSGASDRNLKENFAPVDPRAVLNKVAALPITTWNFKGEDDRHLGPMAQDFYAAFGVGPDDRHITTVDEGGVALAAIQALNQKVEEKDARIAELEKRLTELEARMQKVSEQVEQSTSAPIQAANVRNQGGM
jgi:hypothetical protein